jgi:nitroreductase
MPETNSAFAQLQQIIKGRRTTKSKNMNGRKIADSQIMALLELAHWAPNHGNTEPWLFYVYKDDSLRKFGLAHAEMFMQYAPEEKRNQKAYEKYLHAGDKASHLVIAVMKRGNNPKIPAIEEIEAASAAAQNILLGAAALGIATIWSSGGMTHHPAMKKHLELGEDDLVIALIYLGYTDEKPHEGKRTVPFEEKVVWVE